MTKIININTGKETECDEELYGDKNIDKDYEEWVKKDKAIKEIPKVPTFECSICRCDFEEGEGGLHGGMIGMLPVSFCPTCLSGIFDMVSFLKGDE